MQALCSTSILHLFSIKDDDISILVDLRNRTKGYILSIIDGPYTMVEIYSKIGLSPQTIRSIKRVLLGGEINQFHSRKLAVKYITTQIYNHTVLGNLFKQVIREHLNSVKDLPYKEKVRITGLTEYKIRDWSKVCEIC